MCRCPGNTNNLKKKLNTVPQAQATMCASKITSVSKFVVLPGPLQRPSQDFFWWKRHFLLTQVMSARINFFQGKLKVRQFLQHARIDRKRLMTNVVGLFWLFLHFLELVTRLFGKIPPLGSKDSSQRPETTRVRHDKSTAQRLEKTT